MKWNRFTIKTKTDAEDMIICTLAEIGVEGAEIQDHQPLTEEDKAQMFVDIMPEGPEDDGVRLKSLRQRIRTGSTTGKNFFISSMWMIS